MNKEGSYNITPLVTAIKSWFYFSDTDEIQGIPLIKSEVLTREQVEEIAFSGGTPDIIAKDFQRIITVADKEPGRMWVYVLEEDGLKLTE